jgi:fructosamine-3-kinase
MSLPPGARNPRRVEGGDINEAFRVTLADGGDAFVKTRADARSEEYAAEAAGLEWLAEPGALRTPRVLDVDERYLVLEWIDPGVLDPTGVEELGRGLARTHAAGAPHFGAPLGAIGAGHGAKPDERGADRPDPRKLGSNGQSTFGSLRLPNDPAADWPSFYAERRLRPLAALARDRDALSGAGVRAVEAVCERMTELAGPAEPPARLHGDLWSGNVMADAHGRPWLIDPSAYGGHREVDLAMLRLFGAPEERVFDVYEEVSPLAEGWRERVGLYQLLPLLVHALLFGGSYRSAAERAALRYGR